MADVAKIEQVVATIATVETKEPQKVVENIAALVEVEKKDIPAKEEKSETPVVNGDATAHDDKKDETVPASEPVTTDKVKGDNFFTKLKKQISFKNINILKKRKAPQEVIKEKDEQEATTEKAEDKNKEKEGTDDKKVEASPEKSDDKKETKAEDSSTSKPAEVKKEVEKSTKTTPKPADEKVEVTKIEEKKVEQPKATEEVKPEVKQEVVAADDTKSADNPE